MFFCLDVVFFCVAGILPKLPVEPIEEPSEDSSPFIDSPSFLERSAAFSFPTSAFARALASSTERPFLAYDFAFVLIFLFLPISDNFFLAAILGIQDRTLRTWIGPGKLAAPPLNEE